MAGHRWPSAPAHCPQHSAGHRGAGGGSSAACSLQKSRCASSREEPLQRAGTMAQGLQGRDSSHPVLPCPACSATEGKHGPGALPCQDRRCLAPQGHNSCRAPLQWPQTPWSRAWQVRRCPPALVPCSDTCVSPEGRPWPAFAVPTQTLHSTSRTLTSPCTRLGTACAPQPAGSCI